MYEVFLTKKNSTQTNGKPGWQHEAFPLSFLFLYGTLTSFFDFHVKGSYMRAMPAFPTLNMSTSGLCGWGIGSWWLDEGWVLRVACCV